MPNPTPEQRIAESVLALLRAKGPKAVTIESVAIHANMARTTIYRRYRDREEMLTGVMAPIADPEPPSADATPTEVLQWLLEQSRASVEAGLGFGGMAALLTEEEPWFTDTMRSLLIRHRETLARVVIERIETGALSTGLDVETLLDCMVGAYVAEKARSGEVQDGWIERASTTLRPIFTEQP